MTGAVQTEDNKDVQYPKAQVYNNRGNHREKRTLCCKALEFLSDTIHEYIICQVYDTEQTGTKYQHMDRLPDVWPDASINPDFYVCHWTDLFFVSTL